MNREIIIQLLGEEKVKEIEEKAKSFIRGSFKDYKGLDSYLRELTGSSNMKVINTETGEVLNDAFLKIPEVIIAQNAFFAKMEDIKGRGPDERGHFYNVVRNESMNLNGLLSHGDRKLLLLLEREQFKKYSFEQNGKWFTSEELCKIWRVKESTCKNIRSRFSKAKIIKSKPINSHEKVYQISESYAYIGKNNGEKFIKIFHDKLDEIIKKVQEEENSYDVKPKYSALGTLQGMLPYFHQEFLYLSKNPIESVLKGDETIQQAFNRESRLPIDKRTMKYLSVNSLAQILSKDGKMKLETIINHLKCLERAKAIWMKSSTYKKASKPKKKEKQYLKIKVHPFLTLSKDLNINDEYIQFQISDFEM